LPVTANSDSGSASALLSGRRWTAALERVDEEQLLPVAVGADQVEFLVGVAQRAGLL
jgi:hypothetical protein